MIKSYDARIPDTTRKTKRKETEKDVELFLTSDSSTAEIQVKGEKASAVYQRYRAYIIRNGYADRLQAIQRKNRVFLAKKEET